jgi:hypothetical protein
MESRSFFLPKYNTNLDNGGVRLFQKQQEIYRMHLVPETMDVIAHGYQKGNATEDMDFGGQRAEGGSEVYKPSLSSSATSISRTPTPPQKIPKGCRQH